MKKVVVQMKRTLSIVLALMMVATTVPQAAMTVMADDAIVEVVEDSIVEDSIVEEEVAAEDVIADDVIVEEAITEDAIMEESVVSEADDAIVEEIAEEEALVESEETFGTADAIAEDGDAATGIKGLTVKEKREGVDELINIPFAPNYSSDIWSRYEVDEVDWKFFINIREGYNREEYYVQVTTNTQQELGVDRFYVDELYLGDVSEDNKLTAHYSDGVDKEYYIKKSDLEDHTLIVMTKKVTKNKVKVTYKRPEGSTVHAYICNPVFGSNGDITSVSENEITSAGIEVETLSLLYVRARDESGDADYILNYNGIESWIPGDEAANKFNLRMIRIPVDDVELTYRKQGKTKFDPNGGMFTKDGLKEASTDCSIYTESGVAIDFKNDNWANGYDFSKPVVFKFSQSEWLNSMSNIAPVKENYKFAGWYETTADGEIDLSKHVTSFDSEYWDKDTVLKALWRDKNSEGPEDARITFDPNGGQFDLTKIRRSYPKYNKSAKEPFVTTYFQVTDPKQGEVGKYGVNIENWDVIRPSRTGYTFFNWCEPNEDGTPNLSKQYPYRNLDESEVRTVTYVAAWTINKTPLPNVTLVDVTKDSKGLLTFTADVDYDTLKKSYDPETEILKFMYHIGTKIPNSKNWDNPNKGSNYTGWYYAWDGLDVDMKNGLQTKTIRLYPMFNSEVQEVTDINFSVKYVAIRKDEINNPEHYIYRAGDTNEWITRQAEWPKKDREYVLEPLSYSVNVNVQSSDFTYTIDSASTYEKKFFKKADGFTDSYLVGLKESAGVKLVVTAKNSRVPVIEIGGVKLPDVEGKASKVKGCKDYEYTIPNDKLVTTEDAVNVINIDAKAIEHTVKIAVKKENAVITEARVGSLNYVITSEEVVGGYEFKIPEGETLTVTLTAKPNCTIDKYSEETKVNGTEKTVNKNVKKTAFVYAVTPKAVNGNAASVTTTFDTTAKEVVTVKQGENVLKAGKNKSYTAEYGIEYVVAYEVGNSAEDSDIPDTITVPKFYEKAKTSKEADKDITIANVITDNEIKFTIPVEYAGKTVIFKSNDGKVEANFVVKPSVSKITAIKGAKKSGEVFTVKQAKDTKISYALTAKEKTATMSDISANVISGNGIKHVYASNGNLVVTTKADASASEENVIVIKRGTEVVGTLNVTLIAPTAKFAVKKASATFTNVNVIAAKDKKVIKSLEGATKAIYNVKVISKDPFNEAVKNTTTDKYELTKTFDVDFDNATQELSVPVLAETNKTAIKFNVEVTMTIETAGDEVLATSPKIVKTNLAAQIANSESSPIKFTKKLNKVNSYVSSNAIATYLVAVPKWSKGVNYKYISSNVVVTKKDDSAVDPELIKAYADEKNNIYVSVSGNAAGEYKLKVTPMKPSDGGPVENTAAAGIYEVTVVNSTMTAPALTYPTTWLKANNKATSIKVKTKIPSGYKAAYTISSNDASGKKIKVNAKNGTISVTKDYVLCASRDNIVVTAEIMDKYNNVLFTVTNTVSLIANSPKFGRVVAVTDDGTQYNVVRGNLATGTTYKFIVVKYGTPEKLSYSHDEALENVTITSSNKKALSVVSDTEAKAIKASANKQIKITATAQDGSKQKAVASYIVK